MSSVVNLSSLSQKDLAPLLASASNIPSAYASPIANTLSRLYYGSPSSNGFSSSPSNRLNFSSPSLVPSNLLLLSSHGHVPSSNAQHHLRELAVNANEVANSLGCGSLLAGQGSESDEYGDVAVWLGEGVYGLGDETEVLKALGLEHWIGKAAQIQGIDLSSAGLPSTFQLSLSAQSSRLIDLLSAMYDKYAFCIEGSPGASGNVLYFLLGRLKDGSGSGWAGLVGTGIWT